MFYAGYQDMWRVVQDMATRMPDVDAIAGVPVSGLAPAGMLSAVTGIKAVPLDCVPANVKRLLVIEDASGFAKFRNQKVGQADGREVLYGSVYVCGAARDLDFVGVIADKPRVFAWNLFKSDKCGRIAYDMDGVLCQNPTADQIDYGPKYDAFISSTLPLRVVRRRLGWIVTGRMERYRAATEAWLDRNGIQCGQLVMAGDNHQHTLEAHAKHKADWYVATDDCMMFVESHPRQAARIAELSGKPVVCYETDQSWNMNAAQEPKAQKRHDRIIYTISTGNYGRHAPRNVRVPDGWDYAVLTSADCPGYLTSKQQAAWAKINACRIFSEYEASLCVDDDMTVLQDPTPLFRGPLVFLSREKVSTWHKDLKIVYSERRAITAEQRDAEILRLTQAGFADSPNYMTGVIYREHNDANMALCDEWWYWYSQSETMRDQPSLAVACQKLGATPATITEDGMREHIKHDIRRAERNGVKYMAEEQTKAPRKKRSQRRGDTL